METWTVKRILDWIEDYLGRNGDANPRLSARWLVGDTVGLHGAELFTQLDRPLSADERDTLRDYTRRRAAGEPLQYITGTTDFRFITVAVRNGVLIPRPETEVLVSEALAAAAPLHVNAISPLGGDSAASPEPGEPSDSSAEAEAGQGDESADDDAADTPSEPVPQPRFRVMDLCTGSGCIAAAIASEIPYAEVLACDIDPAAVDLARENAATLGLDDRVRIVCCDCAAPEMAQAGPVDLLIANPPYIPTALVADLDTEVVGFENGRALDGGADGLDVYRRILPLALSVLDVDGVLAVELHETTLDIAAEAARAAGFHDVRIANDLAGRPRVLIARAPSGKGDIHG